MISRRRGTCLFWRLATKRGLSLFLKHTDSSGLAFFSSLCSTQLCRKQYVGAKAKNRNFYVPTLAIREVNEKPQFQQPLLTLSLLLYFLPLIF